MVRLSAREHYIAHVLLIRCAIGRFRRSAALAAHYMHSACSKHKRNSVFTARTYEFVRREAATAQKQREVHKSTRKKIGDAHRGKKISNSARQQMSEKLRNRISFFLIDENGYRQEKDFYRFCNQHGIGRTQIQAGLHLNPIHVVLAGKHKGKTFSWIDIGIVEHQIARATALKSTTAKRGHAVKAIHKARAIHFSGGTLEDK